MHHARGNPDFFIGKSGRLLLKKVDETALPLKGRQQHEPGRMHAFRRIGRFRPGQRKLFQTFIHFFCETGIDEKAPTPSSVGPRIQSP
jgi:hypothetical protein